MSNTQLILRAVSADQQATEHWKSNHLRQNFISLTHESSHIYSMRVDTGNDQARIYAIGGLAITKVPLVTTAIDATEINNAIAQMIEDINHAKAVKARPKKFSGRLLR
jgi:hypothetical protein